MVLSSLVSLLATVLRLASEVGIVIVVATVVRRHRPDAWRPLLVWAILSALVPVAFQVASFPAYRLGLDPRSVFAVLTALHAVAAVVLSLVLIRALIRIAQPPKSVLHESRVPYR